MTYRDETATTTGEDVVPPTRARILGVVAGCSVATALAAARLAGALVLAIVDESRRALGAVTRETLQSAAPDQTCGEVMTGFGFELRFRETLRPEASSSCPPPASQCPTAA